MHNSIFGYDPLNDRIAAMNGERAYRDALLARNQAALGMQVPIITKPQEPKPNPLLLLETDL